MDDFLKLYDHINRFGFPLVFIFGALRGWWYLKPHVDLLIERLQEVNKISEHLEAQAKDAIAVAEESNKLANRAMDLAEANNRKIDEIMAGIKILLDRRC